MSDAINTALLVLQAAMAWNDDGTMIASASDKGTVLRVYKLPQVSKAALERARIELMATYTSK